MKVWAQDPWDCVSKCTQHLWMMVGSDSGSLFLEGGICQNIKPEKKK